MTTASIPVRARASLPLSFLPMIFPVVLIYGFLTWCFLFMTLQFARPRGELSTEGMPAVTGMENLGDLVLGLSLVNLLFFLLVGVNLAGLRLSRSRNWSHWVMGATSMLMLVLLQIAVMRFQQANGG